MSRLDPKPVLEGGRAEYSTRDETTGLETPIEMDYVVDGEVVGESIEEEDTGRDWLELARNSYDASTTWLQADMYRQWERNIHNMRSLHPPGSKYHTPQYKFRSKMFRPKTKTNARKMEAAVVASLFSNRDLIYLEAQNQNNPIQVLSATINQALLQERLENTVPWFENVVGAVQDAETYGLVISYQEWEYEESEEGRPLVDQPNISLVAPENIRLDRAADWTDPINKSPYLIELLPMYVSDVLERMEKIDQKTGQPEWEPLTVEQLVSSNKEEYDSLRSARVKPETDPHSSQRTPSVREFDTVWIHRNFIRIDGVDQVYYTAGTEYLLTDPKPVQEVYPHLQYRERPYAAGTLALEAHKVFPESPAQMGQTLQAAANDIANRRHDNVMLAMDKRFFIRREANIDRDALFRTTPGGGIETDDPTSDVKIVETGDVTSSAYQEQDRVNMDFDDLMGSFNNGTVQGNRKLGETVGGMNLMAASSDAQTDYSVRTLVLTWVKKVISQLVRLEQYYESDEYILAIAADKAQMYQQFGTAQITDGLLRQNLTVNVNMGISATDPKRRIEALMTATNSLVQMPGVAQRLKTDEYIKEIFATVGYQDGSRFVAPEEEGQRPSAEEFQALQEQLQIAQQKLATKDAEIQGRIQVEKLRSGGLIEEARVRGEYQLGVELAKQRVDDLNILIKSELNDIKKAELELERDSLTYQILAERLNMKMQSKAEMIETGRANLEAAQTGTVTPSSAAATPPELGDDRASQRVGDSRAGTIERDKYGKVLGGEG